MKITKPEEPSGCLGAFLLTLGGLILFVVGVPLIYTTTKIFDPDPYHYVNFSAYCMGLIGVIFAIIMLIGGYQIKKKERGEYENALSTYLSQYWGAILTCPKCKRASALDIRILDESKKSWNEIKSGFSSTGQMKSWKTTHYHFKTTALIQEFCQYCSYQGDVEFVEKENSAFDNSSNDEHTPNYVGDYGNYSAKSIWKIKKEKEYPNH